MARYCTRENAPLGKWNGVPIYLTTIVTAVFVLGLLFSAILQSLRSPLLLDLTFYLPGNDLNWLAAFTYPLIDRLSFFTPFGIFFIYRFAVGIETHLGRAVLTRLMLLLVLVPVVIGCLMWWGFGISTANLGDLGLQGNQLFTIGLVIAFATLYPNADALGWVPFKWVAFACLLCGSLMALSDRDWVTLIALWGLAAASYYYIRHAVESDHDDAIPVLARVRSMFRKKPKLRVVPAPVPSAGGTPISRTIPQEVDLEIDPLLDKIAKSGLGSLSKAERAKLERARQELLKKEHS
jgi:hypothetical protein